MKTSHMIFLGVIVIIAYNLFLIQRDEKMFDGYDYQHQHCGQLCKVQ